MKQELQNWVTLSLIISIVLVAAVQATAFTADVSENLCKSAQQSVVATIK